MRLATFVAFLVLAAGLPLGCGGSSGESSTGSSSPGARSSTAPAGSSVRACPLNVGGIRGLRATGVSCGEAQRVASAWRRSSGCVATPDASHGACTVRSYRCIATATDRGWSVSCAKPSRSIAFTAHRD